MEHKTLSLTEPQLVDTDSGEIAGYASTYDWDSVGEKVVPGAFTEHIGEFLTHGFVAAGHDWTTPIGVPVEAYEDEKGLFVRARFHSTQHAQDVRRVIRERMDAGKSARLSIGYEVLEDEQVEEGRLLKKLRLHEWSYVTVPANGAAMVMASKSGEVSTLGFNEHAEAAVSVVAAFAERARDRAEFRLKEGRMLSGANVTKIQGLLPQLMDVHKALSDLLEAAAPKTEKSMAETHALRAQTAALQQRLRALGVRTHGNGTDL
jgi:HK97 family phage prohead protease